MLRWYQNIARSQTPRQIQFDVLDKDIQAREEVCIKTMHEKFDERSIIDQGSQPEILQFLKETYDIISKHMDSCHAFFEESTLELSKSFHKISTSFKTALATMQSTENLFQILNDSLAKALELHIYIIVTLETIQSIFMKYTSKYEHNNFQELLKHCQKDNRLKAFVFHPNLLICYYIAKQILEEFQIMANRLAREQPRKKDGSQLQANLATPELANFIARGYEGNVIIEHSVIRKLLEDIEYSLQAYKQLIAKSQQMLKDHIDISADDYNNPSFFIQ